MNSLTINISDSTYQKIEQLAKDKGISCEKLLVGKINEWLTESEDDFEEVINYVLDKNKELYRRLA